MLLTAAAVPSVPRSVAIPVVVVSALIPLNGLLAAGFGARSLGMARAVRYGVAVMLVLSAWGAAVVGLTAAGWFLGRHTAWTPVYMFLGWAAPMLVALFVLRRHHRLRAVMSSRSSLGRLAYAQAARVLGLVFLVLHGQDKLPALFAYPAAWGDVLAAVTAPVAAFGLWRRFPEIMTPGSGWRWLVIGWNIIGLADHVIAVLMGVISYPGVLQLADVEVTTIVFAELPMSLFPTFMVPYADALHLFMLDVLLFKPGATPAPESNGVPEIATLPTGASQ